MLVKYFSKQCHSSNSTRKENHQFLVICVTISKLSITKSKLKAYLVFCLVLLIILLNLNWTKYKFFKIIKPNTKKTTLNQTHRLTRFGLIFSLTQNWRTYSLRSLYGLLNTGMTWWWCEIATLHIVTTLANIPSFLQACRASFQNKMYHPYYKKHYSLLHICIISHYNVQIQFSIILEFTMVKVVINEVYINFFLASNLPETTL